MAKSKKEKIIKSVEIELLGGPCDGKTMEVAYPTWPSYMLDMGRSLYVRKTSTEYEYSTDMSLHSVKTIAEILESSQ